MTEPLSILNLGGHPKDAIMYAGGTMAKHVARGDRSPAEKFEQMTWMHMG